MGIVNVAYAGSLDDFIAKATDQIINPLILLLFALAVVFFLYGALKFFTSGQNEEKRTQGKSHMLWGIIGMTIMMAVFFIMKVVLNTFNIRGVDVDKVDVDLDDYNPTYP